MPVEAKIPKDITPQIAVLSLVVQQADSVAGISRRLREQFPVAQFPASSAHNNLKSLAEAGYVRLMEQGTETSWNRYEATAAGKEFARQWVMRSSLPPMMRDPLQGKLAFAECGEIAPLICLLEKEEAAFKVEYDKVQSRFLAHKRFRDDRPLDWRAELEAIKLKDEVELFGVMTMRRKKRREELQGLLDHLGEG